MSRAAVAVAAVMAVLGAGCSGDGANGDLSAGAAKATSAPTTVASSPAPTSATGAAPATAVPPTAPATTAPAPCAVPPNQPAPPGTVRAAYPTALAFAPDGRLFWAERAGTVRVWQGGEAREFATVSTATTEAGGGYSERGLLGLAISPTFTRDRFVYAFYSNTDRSKQTVVRWTDCVGEGRDATTIVELPGGSDCCHKGGRLAFGPDGKLYVSLGEEHVASAAQDTSDPRGKILRYNPDGSVPADNPFGAGNPVWAYGFRNPFGLAISSTGQVAVTSNGPTGDAGAPSSGYDTVVAAVAKGGGYQWPLCYGYSHALRGGGCGDGQSEPDWSSEGGTVVPTGATFVDSAGPAPYAGKLVFCTFNGGMRILMPGSPHATVASGPSACNLDVKQGPDKALYMSDLSGIYRVE